MLGCILLATLKVFDMIDHSVLIEELRKMHVHPVLVNWINAFLCSRTQAVRIESVISEWKAPVVVYHRDQAERHLVDDSDD